MSKDESVEETLSKVYDELASDEDVNEVEEEVQEPINEGGEEDGMQNEDDGQESPIIEEEKPQKREKEVKRGKKEVVVPQQDEKIDYPAGFTAEEKEQFAELEPFARKRTLAIINGFREAHRKTQIEITNKEKALEQERGAIKTVFDQIEPHLKDWGQAGITKEQAIGQLIQFRELCKRDADTAIDALAQSLGRKVTIENRGSKAPIQQNAEILQNPYIKQLEEKIKILEDNHNQQKSLQQQQYNEAVDRTFEDFRNVKHSNKFLYPDLHDENFVKGDFIKYVGLIRQTNPTLPLVDVFHRAYYSSGGRFSEISNQELPQNNNITHTQRAKASILPSGGYRASNGFQDDAHINPNESVEETIKRVFNQYDRR